MATLNYRLIPHKGSGGAVTVNINGKKLPTSTGTVYDVPVGGQSITGVIIAGLVGASTLRPLVSKAGDKFIDTTLSKVVFSDGDGNWYDPFTGAVV